MHLSTASAASLAEDFCFLHWAHLRTRSSHFGSWAWGGQTGGFWQPAVLTWTHNRMLFESVRSVSSVLSVTQYHDTEDWWRSLIGSFKKRNTDSNDVKHSSCIFLLNTGQTFYKREISMKMNWRHVCSFKRKSGPNESASHSMTETFTNTLLFQIFYTFFQNKLPLHYELAAVSWWASASGLLWTR